MRLQFLTEQEKQLISNNIDSAQTGFRAALKAALQAQRQRRYGEAFLQAGVALECSRELAIQLRDAPALQSYCDTARLIQELLQTLGFDQLLEPFIAAFNRDRSSIGAGSSDTGLLSSLKNNQQSR